MTGMSLGELLLVFLLVGVILSEGLRNVQAAVQHVSQTEIFALSIANKEYWVETWANDGLRPPESVAPFEASKDGEYVASWDDQAVDGTATFALTARMGALVGDQVTLRPAFSAATNFSVLWVCGFAPVPRGFVARGANRTTLEPAQLVSTCRAPQT
jgi:hypothetical protein